MSKHILAVTQDEFRWQVKKISTSSLKSLLMAIQEYKTGQRLSEPELIDLERKFSKIQRELQERSYLTPKDQKDFNKWIFNQRGKTSW